MADLLFRGRGADIGVRAPAWLLRLAGAALGFALYTLADTLGVWATLGVGGWYVQLGLLALGAVLAPTRAGGLLWLVAGLLVTLTCVVSFTPIVRPIASAFVRSDREPPEPVDAVVVLSGGMTDEGLVSGAAIDRLLTGLEAAKTRRVPSVLLSVLEKRSARAVVTTEADQRSLASLIVPEADVRVVRDVHSTHDEALAFAAVARTHRWQRVLLVTSPLHTRRACAAVEVAGLAVQCMPSRPRDYSLRRLTGTQARRQAFADVLYESAATMLYRARGWM